ncbi:hypothetical protein D6D85_10280 [Candidatus Methanodesulfokora washburnensis]|uniref:Uncharacterized protein n=1 Tax=Candidatus Methanodesulfokora washburnensis TaxID=2478471 RepID=A0A429GI04_9CREN|nr:hypothetical protein D6D85_10280 [Candidatus Methanodesulfokores washburnensis]
MNIRKGVIKTRIISRSGCLIGMAILIGMKRRIKNIIDFKGYPLLLYTALSVMISFPSERPPYLRITFSSGGMPPMLSLYEFLLRNL